MSLVSEVSNIQLASQTVTIVTQVDSTDPTVQNTILTLPQPQIVLPVADLAHLIQALLAAQANLAQLETFAQTIKPIS